jgi:hypothetical protein
VEEGPSIILLQEVRGVLAWAMFRGCLVPKNFYLKTSHQILRYIHGVLNLDETKKIKAMFSSFKIPKILQDSSSHQIFGRMHGALNVGKNN